MYKEKWMKGKGENIKEEEAAMVADEIPVLHDCLQT